MTPLDLPLAGVGLLASTVKQVVGGSRRAVWGVVAVLVLVSAVPTVIIGSSQRPTDLTFDDVRLARIPAMTTWVRMQGDLRIPKGVSSGVYELHDFTNDRLYVSVVALEPLDTGRTELTGRLSLASLTAGSIGSIDADVPAVPRRDEPFALILLPAFLGIVVAFGMRLGYPVVRRERPPDPVSSRLAAGEPLSVRWSGRIGSETVARDTPVSSTLIVDVGPYVIQLSLTGADAIRTARMRRAAPVRYVRLCRVFGRAHGVELHARSDDLILSFDDRATRDRFAATLE